jgi:type VI secretion system protein ImpC
MPSQSIWQALQVERPLVARLALLTSLPVRVTPAFLRLVRLRLVADASTGDEADLWLSDLVETRSSAGLSYRRGVRDTMRQMLAADPALLDALWTHVHLEHAPWLASRGRLEEELTWRLLRDPGDAWIDSNWRRVLEELEMGPNAEGVARWVVRAVPDLPPGTLDLESGRRAYYGANLLLGDARVLGHEAQTFLDSKLFAFATRRLPRHRIHVGRIEGGLLLSSLRAIENGFELDIPATHPLWLQLEGGPTNMDFVPRVITMADQEPVTCSTGIDTVTLRLIDGSAYSIGPRRQTQTKFIARNRTPRVQIEFEVELDGVLKQVQLPFVTGVLADLSGHRVEALPDVAERRLLEIDVDTFDAHMQAIRPRLVFEMRNRMTGRGSLAVDLAFSALDDFLPGRLVGRIEPLREWLDDRNRLRELLAWLDETPRAHHQLKKRWLEFKGLQQMAQARDIDSEALRSLARRMAADLKSVGAEQRALVERGILALARPAQAHPKLGSTDLRTTLDTMLGATDTLLSSQLAELLHHPEFQQLESAWRGLHFLVTRTETNEMLKIRVMNISKQELAETQARYRGDAWARSPIFKQVYEREFGQFGGSPYGCLLGDYHFDHSPADVELLRDMAKLASESLAPFIAGASATLMQSHSWQELAYPADLSKRFRAPEYAAWNLLRDSEEARYLALAMPRFLARLPYRRTAHPGEAFGFEEPTNPMNPSEHVWVNAAYAMASNIHRAFSQYGWCARIRGVESGGAVEGLLLHTLAQDDGGVVVKCPTEVAISASREAELARNGLMAMVHRQNSDVAWFIGAQSMQKPAEHEDPDATVNAALAARLPYLFAVCRFSQHLKCIARDKLGSLARREDVERWSNQWLMDYVDGDPNNSSEVTKAMRPLAAAEVALEETPAGTGAVLARIYLRPHYQLEGLTTSLRQITHVPSGL